MDDDVQEQTDEEPGRYNPVVTVPAFPEESSPWWGAARWGSVSAPLDAATHWDVRIWGPA